MRKAFLKRNQWPQKYFAPIRVLNPRTNQVVTEEVAFLLPHEFLACLHKYGDPAVISETVGMDPVTYQHLNHCRQTSGDWQMKGAGMHGDGVPCNWDKQKC